MASVTFPRSKPRSADRPSDHKDPVADETSARSGGAPAAPELLPSQHCRECGFIGPMLAQEYAYDSPAHYDGISEWMCPDCGSRFGRWTRRLLTNGMVEWPHGRARKTESERPSDCEAVKNGA